jgi:hypothetical protein
VNLQGKNSAILLASVLTLAGIIYSLTKPKTNAPQAVNAIDISDSVRRNCGCALFQVRRKFNDPKMAHGTVTVIASGDQPSADEPTLVAVYDVPFTRRVVEGPKATLRKQESLLADLKMKCESLPTSKRSPIGLLVRRGLERLQQGGCGPRLPGCELIVQTDAEETADPAIRKLLNGETPKKGRGSAPLFNNTGVVVTFVALSETVGEKQGLDGQRQHHLTRERDLRSVQRNQDVWRSLFTDPDRVHFEPFCPTN